MKYTYAVAAAAVGLQLQLAAASDSPPNNLPSATMALQAAKDTALPAGVTLTGSVEPLRNPSDKKLELAEDPHECFSGGCGRWGGWGRWGGFHRFGAFRFKFNCGGLGGWAYPLDFWNTFGVDLYGGGCGLGFPYGDLFFC